MQKTLTYWILTVVTMVPILGCFKEEAKFDQFVGQTEFQVKAQFGKPKSEQVGPAEMLGGELRYPIRKRVPGTNEVKELYFCSRWGERIFWLVSSSNTWTVVADVKIPPGMEF